MTVSEEPGWKLLNSLLTSNPEKWRQLFYKSCKLELARLSLESEKLLRFRNEHISEAMSLTYRQPLHLTRGAGQYLFDDRKGRPLGDSPVGKVQVLLEQGLNTWKTGGLGEKERLCRAVPGHAGDHMF